MKRVMLAIVLVGLLTSPAKAHIGHHDRIMGTVSAIHDTRLEIKGTTGKTSTVVLTDQTKVLQGAHAVKRTDIKEGARVVVTAMSMKGADGKAMLMAEEVRLGTAPAPKAKARARTR